jgi:2-haloacid dehalogenase
MRTHRREFLKVVGGAVAGGLALRPLPALAEEEDRVTGRVSGANGIEAVAFDAFTLLDGRPVVAAAERLVPGQGAKLVEIWRNRLFEYSWLRTAGGRYLGFEAVSAEALAYAGATVQPTPSAEVRRELLEAMLQLPAWPEGASVLRELRASGRRLAFLSNFTPRMLAGLSRSSKLEGLLDALSTDAVRTYKPDPRAYQLAVDAFRVPKERIAFVAHGGWDAVGGAWFGFPTFWINRTGIPREELGAPPYRTLTSLSPLPALLAGGAGASAGSQ